jgi:beta-glucanase (GH16 family)
MEHVGYDPSRIHSTVHTKANNHMLHNHPTNAVIVGDAVSTFKIYTLEWNTDKLEMFVGDEANPFQTRIFIWNKQEDWTKWYLNSFFYDLVYLFFHRPFDKPFRLLMNIAVGGTW